MKPVLLSTEDLGKIIIALDRDAPLRVRLEKELAGFYGPAPGPGGKSPLKKARRKSLGALMKQIPALHAETASLCQSEIACAVADAWQACERDAYDVTSGLADALDRLEEATRTSELRKVKP